MNDLNELKMSRAKDLKEPRKCGSCGKWHCVVPTGAKILHDGLLSGVYWDCDCKSTLFMPEEAL